MCVSCPEKSIPSSGRRRLRLIDLLVIRFFIKLRVWCNDQIGNLWTLIAWTCTDGDEDRGTQCCVNRASGQERPITAVDCSRRRRSLYIIRGKGGCQTDRSFSETSDRRTASVHVHASSHRYSTNESTKGSPTGREQYSDFSPTR
jgi:hypothetical protein